MNVRAGIRQLIREIGVPSSNGACPGVACFIRLIQEGDPVPEAPPCPLCDKRHWPHPSVQAICVVEIGKALPRADGGFCDPA
jgi:hypothetical protein